MRSKRAPIVRVSPCAVSVPFTLRYVEELGNREIAALLGTSSAVVAVTLHQARTKLKKRLSALERGMGWNGGKS